MPIRGGNPRVQCRFVGPFEITERINPVAYRLRLPEDLNGVHDTFHVSNLKKCLADPTLQVPLDEIKVDAKLNFMEEPMEILEMEFKKLKRSRIAIVKTKKESSDEECLTSGSEDKEYAIAVRDFKKFFKRRGYGTIVLKDKTSSKTDSDINSVSIHNWEDTDDDDVVILDSFQGYDFGNTHKDKSDHERSYTESVPIEVNAHASDPFGLDGLILKSAKKHAKIPHSKSDSDPTFPPGFTPDISLQPDNAAEKVTKESTPLSSPIHAKNDSPIVHEVEESNNNMGKVTGSEHIEIFKEDHHDSMSRSSKPINGFSIVDRF
ncbi:hypothetical protein Tco_0072855 [Tanacetum coccineum]